MFNWLHNKNELIAQKPKGDTEEERALDMFKDVYGKQFDGIKVVLYSALVSDKPVNILLVGHPGCAKTLFLKIIMKVIGKDKCIFYDGTNSTSAGLIEELDRKKETVKVLTMDEIGKQKKNDLDSVRGLTNDGTVSKTLRNKEYNISLPNLKIFATSNDLKLPKPIKSRFLILEIPEYTNEEFVECVTYCLRDRFKPDVAEVIAQTLLKNGLKDVRKAINFSGIITKENDYNAIKSKLETLIKSNPSNEDLDYN